MTLVVSLIDKWTVDRSRRALAAALSISEQRLSDFYVGRRLMPPSKFALMAELVEGEAKARNLLWDYLKARPTIKERITEGFNALLSIARPGYRMPVR